MWPNSNVVDVKADSGCQSCVNLLQNMFEGYGLIVKNSHTLVIQLLQSEV